MLDLVVWRLLTVPKILPGSVNRVGGDGIPGITEATTAAINNPKDPLL